MAYDDSDDDDLYLYDRYPINVYEPFDEKKVKKLYIQRHPITQDTITTDTIIVDGYVFIHVPKWDSTATWPPDMEKLKCIVNTLNEKAKTTAVPIGYCVLVEDQLETNAFARPKKPGNPKNCLRIGTELLNTASNAQLKSCVLHELDHMEHKDTEFTDYLSNITKPTRYMFDNYPQPDSLREKLRSSQTISSYALNEFYNSALHALTITENLYEHLNKHPLFQQLSIESVVYNTEALGDSFREHILQYRTPSHTEIDLATLSAAEIEEHINKLNQRHNDDRGKVVEILEMLPIIKKAHETRSDRAPIRAGRNSLILPAIHGARKPGSFTKDSANHPSDKARLEHNNSAAAGIALDEVLMTGAPMADASAAVASGAYQSSQQVQAAADLEMLGSMGLPVTTLRRPLPVRPPESQIGEHQYALAVRAQDKPRER